MKQNCTNLAEILNIVVQQNLGEGNVPQIKEST